MSFKASNTGKDKENKPSEISNIVSNDEIVYLVLLEKKKGKISLNCFNYGKQGHFSSKCSFEKQDDIQDERNEKARRRKIFFKCN